MARQRTFGAELREYHGDAATNRRGAAEFGRGAQVETFLTVDGAP